MGKKEKPYVISLPENFPEELIQNLDTGSFDTIKNIYHSYTNIPKEGATYAASKKDALGHFFFRNIKQGKYNNGMAKILLDMFKSNSENYVFFVGNLAKRDSEGNRLSLEQAKTFRQMELAYDMESKRKKPKDCYGEAGNLISLFGRDNQ